MNTIIVAEIKGKGKETEGTVGKVSYYKTKTKLEVQFTEETHGSMDLL